MKWTCLLAAGAMGLVACTESPQHLHSNASIGEPAYQGTGSNFVAPDWTPGDKGSWEQSLKVRARMGQNEYNKAN